MAVDSALLAVSQRQALACCRRHYENFPVASWLLPAAIRPAVAAIYRFAREADDLADEGEATTAERLAALDQFEQQWLRQLHQLEPPTPRFAALIEAIEQFQLDPALLQALLTAFRHDLTVTRYATYDDLLHYCQHSANPIGRLLLQLVQIDHPAALTAADSLCTALQLLNFLQDLRQDWLENGRIYLPQQQMAQFEVTERHFAEGIDDGALRRLVAWQLAEIETLLAAAGELPHYFSGRFHWEIRLIWASALRLQQRLQSAPSCWSRPRLRFWDGLPIVALMVQRLPPHA